SAPLSCTKSQEGSSTHQQSKHSETEQQHEATTPLPGDGERNTWTRETGVLQLQGL
ncbi:Hypothetical predicted protein, partial [Pelobates cultripes]